MKKYNYLILGSGVGKAIAALLIKQSDTGFISLADLDYRHAMKAVIKIKPDWEVGRGPLEPMHFDVEDTSDRAFYTLFSQYDVVISAIPAKYNTKLAKLAIRAGTHFCDLGGVVEVTQEMLELILEAVKNKVAVISDCGLMPGDGNIIVQHDINVLNSPHPLSAVIRVGGLGQFPREPSNYQRTFSLQGLKHLCYDQVPVVSNGAVVELAPFSMFHRQHIEELAQHFPQFPQVELFASAGAGTAPWTFQKQNVKEFYELTIRWPGFVDFVRDIPADKFEETVGPQLPPSDADHPDLVYMDVITKELGGENRKRVTRLLGFFDTATGLTAMERTTGFSTAIIARMLAQGHVSPGVGTPEQMLGKDGIKEFLDTLSQHLDLQIK